MLRHLTPPRCVLLIVPAVMTSINPSIARAVVALAAMAMASHGWAQLAASSPFVPPQANAAGPTAGAPLEFGGYLDTPSGERLYRIKDPARKASEWVRLNERNPKLDVTAKQYDDGHNTLIVEYQGRSLTLAERESKIISAGNVPPPAPVPNPANTMPAAVTQSVVVNPSPADEQRRLEAVAAEVARRRALREQATQQVNQGVPPQMGIPAQAQPNVAPNNQNRTAPANQGQNPPGTIQRGRGQGARQQR